MRSDELEYCENCGSHSRFVPIFAAECSTRRCARCRGWSYAGKVTSEARELYGREYFFGGEYRDYALSAPSQRKNYERKLKLLQRSGCELRPGTRLLEVGCATGEFLAMVAGSRGVRTLGIEVSPYGLAEARARGLSVLSPDDAALDAAVRELQPDFIVAWDVWEHLPRPATIFAGLIAHGSPDLVVAATTVDASSAVARLRGQRWRQFHPPTHLHYPTRRSFEQFFSARALRVVRHEAFGYYRPLLEYALALGLELPRSERWPALPVYLNLWDTQLVVARRQG